MGGSCARAATRGGEGSHVVLVEVGFRLELKDDAAQPLLGHLRANEAAQHESTHHLVAGDGAWITWPRSGGSSSRLRSESEACLLCCDAKSSKALRGLRSAPDLENFRLFPEGESIGDGLLPLGPAPEEEADLCLAGLAAGRGEGTEAGTRAGACATTGFGDGAGAGACEAAVALST